jgi:hypothetical protein
VNTEWGHVLVEKNQAEYGDRSWSVNKESVHSVVYLLYKCLDFAQAPDPCSTIREVISGMEQAVQYLSAEQVQETASVV